MYFNVSSENSSVDTDNTLSESFMIGNIRKEKFLLHFSSLELRCSDPGN